MLYLRSLGASVHRTWQNLVPKILPRYLKRSRLLGCYLTTGRYVHETWATDKAVHCLSLSTTQNINVTNIRPFVEARPWPHSQNEWEYHVGFLDPLKINPTCVPSLKRETLWAKDPFEISFILFQFFLLLMVRLFLAVFGMGIWAYFPSGFLIWEWDFAVFLSGSDSEWCQWHATTLIPLGLCLICFLLAALPMLHLTGLH